MRFSIRDLIWATLVAAMGVGWWVDHRRLEDQREDYRAMEERCQGYETEVRRLKEIVMSYPVVVDGDISMSMGSARVIIAPPGSATAGSEWLEVPVTYTNVSKRPLWVDGYAVWYPFYGIQTRDDPIDEWVEYPIAFCGTGALMGPHKVDPGASWLFKIALPKRYEGQQFRISLPYRTDFRARPNVQAQSAAKVLASSGAR